MLSTATSTILSPSRSAATSATSLTVLRTGSVVVDEALPYYRDSDSPLAWAHVGRGRSHLVEIPVSCYLIEGPHGLVLIDAGFSIHNRTLLGQVANIRFQRTITKILLPSGAAIHEQLEERGIRPQDLDLVLMSHLHCDHVDGVTHLREAPRILVSAPEWKAGNTDPFHYHRHEWKDAQIDTFSWNTVVGPFGAGYDVFGDASLVMVSLPGHSHGMCATVLRSQDQQVDAGPQTWANGADAPGVHDPRRFVLLSADASYGQASYEEGLRPSVVVNADQAQRSLDWVRSVRKDPRCLGVLANHDPDVLPGTWHL
ncbi:N-acyl homoserine lactonase family protein [Actinomyces sp. 2119]|uniref:N-acyl homoserine lactonase family protein n=1 Tax=Actinomyces lilanjuaniae TaxID=2321394 RepID=A0ABN5PSL3_9ACTO|nr:MULTISPECIES: N-acyl homoserine lactonase family protein [Actinomyces]AYD89795.1 N-acyl homoserine lactonase family protein [Actinomyces lilanjuaniae]RJF44770.1 N-acyl homoserine lactonase family protein [Actinomyces sp. 2119]